MEHDLLEHDSKNMYNPTENSRKRENPTKNIEIIPKMQGARTILPDNMDTLKNTRKRI